MDGSQTAPSPQLEAANRRLHELRAQTQVQRRAAGACLKRPGRFGGDPPGDVADAFRTAPSGAAPAFPVLPSHLGWGSAALTAVIRQHGQQNSGCGEDAQNWIVRPLREEPGEATTVTSAAKTHSNSPYKLQTAAPSPPATGGLKLYPDIGLGMLRQGQTAAGRLWLMLRYLDLPGKGLLRIVNIANALTSKTSPLRLCGRRQLRNLVRDGEGIFWVRDREHIWLRSAAKVAYALGVEQLTGRPVALPVAALLDGIGTFRAHLYAAFHSGRTKGTPHGTRVANRYSSPIARDTLAGLSGVGQSSQRAYEARVNVKVQANFAVGEVAREENRENRAWTQGQALFELKDYRGEQGKKGKTYLAWQLPNSFLGQHQKRPRGRQKRINRKLKDLVMKGMPGNVGETSVMQKSDTSTSLKQVANAVEKREKQYFPNGKLAARAYGRGGRGAHQGELYWMRHRTAGSRFVLWQQLG